MEVVITGASSGIGKGLAEYYLERGLKVHGISRRCAINHANYTHHAIDLVTPDFDSNLIFDENEKYLLINNAGILGHVGRLAQLQESDISEVLQVNVVASVKLMHYFSRLCTQDLTVVNISSGAGRSPLPGWLAYCASKAALDMASLVFDAEQQELGRNTRVYSVAPGIVDTPMQEKIRSSNSASFSLLGRFQTYFEQGELSAPQDLGRKLDALLADRSANIICTLRDY